MTASSDQYTSYIPHFGQEIVDTIRYWVDRYKRAGAAAGYSVEDLIQEGAIAALEAAQHPNREHSLRTLTSIFVRNRLHGLSRKNLGFVELGEVDEEAVPAESESLEDIADLKDLLVWLHLHHRAEWKVLTLRFVHRLTCDEVAAKLRKSKATVWRLERSGIARLRNRMVALDTI